MSDDGTLDLPAGAVLDCLQHAVLVTDANGHIRYANPAAERLFGERASDLAGCPCSEVLRLVDERSGQPLPDPVGEALAGPPWTCAMPSATDPMLALQSGDDRLAVRLSVAAMVGDGDTATGAVVSIHDDAGDRMLRRVAAESTAHDPLTRLVNHAEFAQRLKRLLEGGDGPHAMLYLDLDHFRDINDRWGHAAGDYALREITRMFSEMIRTRDTFARLGGDEFGLLMEHCGPGIAEQIANSLHATLVQRPLSWHESTFGLAVSIGGVLIRTDDTRDADALIAAAQTACEQAKVDDSRPVRINT